MDTKKTEEEVPVTVNLERLKIEVGVCRKPQLSSFSLLHSLAFSPTSVWILVSNSPDCLLVMARSCRPPLTAFSTPRFPWNALATVTHWKPVCVRRQSFLVRPSVLRVSWWTPTEIFVFADVVVVRFCHLCLMPLSIVDDDFLVFLLLDCRQNVFVVSHGKFLEDNE